LEAQGVSNPDCVVNSIHEVLRHVLSSPELFNTSSLAMVIGSLFVGAMATACSPGHPDVGLSFSYYSLADGRANPIPDEQNLDSPMADVVSVSAVGRVGIETLIGVVIYTGRGIAATLVPLNTSVAEIVSAALEAEVDVLGGNTNGKA